MTICSLVILLPNFEPLQCSTSGSNCCFLTFIQISQEAGKVAWYSHLFKNFQFVVIHTVKGFSLVSEAEVDVSLEFSCFFCDPAYVGNLISGSSAFSKSCLNICKVLVHLLLKPSLVNFEHYFAAAAAAAKSFQSCPTLCDPIDGSPPGSPIPGLLQARTLEWVAISFSNKAQYFTTKTKI